MLSQRTINCEPVVTQDGDNESEEEIDDIDKPIAAAAEHARQAVANANSKSDRQVRTTEHRRSAVHKTELIAFGAGSARAGRQVRRRLGSRVCPECARSERSTWQRQDITGAL